MKITEPALTELNNILIANGAEGLEVVLQQSCCGIVPAFQLVRFEEGDEPTDVQGIRILMDDDAKQVVENVIIDLQDGELIVLNQRGGGCCGHHGHHHDGEEHECCGHGHHHDGEEHECCGHGHHHDGEEHECCGHGHHHDGEEGHCCHHE